MTVNSPRRRSVAGESLIFAGRLFIHWRRHPVVPIQAVLFPTVLLVIYGLLVSKSMTRITGTNTLEILVPICAVAGGLSGALGAALRIPYDRDQGLLSRMWLMPVHRASALSGTLLAEALRTLVATVLITVVGLVLGLDFQGNAMAFLVFLLVPVLVVVVYAMIVITIAARAASRTMLTWLGTGSIGLVFCSVAPANVIPPLARPLVEFQPMTPTIQGMRDLALGAPALWPLVISSAWLVGLTAVFGPLAVRGYRKAAGIKG
jgi:ABC-2 type transport system permease protein